jgi:acid stress-induced BolA-like protein IbaG/YrbA
MKPQNFSCLVQKLTDDLNKANTQQEIIKDLLWERMNFTIHALKMKTHSNEQLIKMLESTIEKAQKLEKDHLDKQS